MSSIKDSLRAYYKSSDAPIDEEEKARVVALVAEEAARCSTGAAPEAVPLWRFLVGQLRFVNPLAWVAQLALLALMLLLLGAYGESRSTMLIVMTAAALSVAAAAPSVFKSFESNVAELEASCRHDSAQVLVSRLILFGLADVLWMSMAVSLVPAVVGGDPFRVFFCAATPFFASCAVCFHISRITHGRCAKACFVAVSCIIVVLWGANKVFPHWYLEVSLVVWSVALIVALVLAIYEMHRLVSHVRLDGISHTELAVQP